MTKANIVLAHSWESEVSTKDIAKVQLLIQLSVNMYTYIVNVCKQSILVQTYYVGDNIDAYIYRGQVHARHRQHIIVLLHD